VKQAWRDGLGAGEFDRDFQSNFGLLRRGVAR
jgi:hypothetical protein